MAIADNKTSWGGRRAGAGRPGSDKRKRTFYINEHEYQQLRSYLKLLKLKRRNNQCPFIGHWYNQKCAIKYIVNIRPPIYKRGYPVV